MEGSGWGPADGVTGQDAASAEPHMVESIGSQLRTAGSWRIPGSSRLSDFVNYLEGLFSIQDVILRARKRRRLVVMTTAHEIYGYAHPHESGS